MYCTKNNTKEAFFGVSTTNLSPDVTYQSTTTGLFRNKGWIHHRDQSRHAIVERRHEGLNRLDHLTSTQPRFSPPQDRHCLKEGKKNNAIFWSCFTFIHLHPRQNFFQPKTWTPEISGGFSETPRPQACTSQR